MIFRYFQRNQMFGGFTNFDNFLLF